MASDESSYSWFKTMRSPEALELIRKYPDAYILAIVIASRARWSDGFNADGLQPGEAMLGDYRNYGMTERGYRTAKQKLENFGFATFKATGKGTIGKLTDTRLFDPLNIAGDGRHDGQATDARRTSDGQATGNKKVKKERIKKGKTLATASTVSDDNVPAPAGAYEDVLWEEEMREVVLADAAESTAEMPFYVPSPDEVSDFATEQSLDSDAVETFLYDREQDHWQIRKSDGSVEAVRDWRKFLTAFCEKFESDRESFS